MTPEIYEVLSLAMRYWFTLVGVLIVWRAFSWLRKDRRKEHKRLRRLPDAGMVGEFVVQSPGTDALPEGTILSVPREGVLGYSRVNDIPVPASGVAKSHLDFTFIAGQGLRIMPRPRCECFVDDILLSSKKVARMNPLGHGSILQVGDAFLKLHLFAGIDAPRYVSLAEDEPEETPPEQQQSAPGYPTGMPVYPPVYPPVPQGYQQPMYPPMQQGYPPVYQQPIYQQPVYQQPIYQQPVYPPVQPEMNQPVQGDPLCDTQPYEPAPPVTEPEHDPEAIRPRVRHSRRRRYAEDE